MRQSRYLSGDWVNPMKNDHGSGVMSQQYRSKALAAAHETALGLHEAGAMDKQTLKVFDEMCLTPVEQLTPDQIQRQEHS